MKGSFFSALIVLMVACSGSPGGTAKTTTGQPAPAESAPARPATAAAAAGEAPALARGTVPTPASVVPPTNTPPARATTAAPGPGIPSAVLRACDLVAQIAARSKGVTITRRTGPFEDEFESRTRFGCSVSLVGSNAALAGSPSPIDQWRAQFAAKGWQEDVNHSADGPDGTSFAFVRAGVIYMFQGRWDGGDDTDPTVKPDDEYKGAGQCAANDAPELRGRDGAHPAASDRL